MKRNNELDCSVKASRELTDFRPGPSLIRLRKIPSC
jgi:hypothetical protein